MQKQKENVFLDKFRLLNSQERTEEIIWSMSDSSDYEEPTVNEKSNNLPNKTRVLKRKRKKKTPKNVTNLSITVLDTSKTKIQNGETSPILVSKIHQKSLKLSPILASNLSSQLPRRVHPESPILPSKNYSPKTNGFVRKKLFAHQQGDYGMSEDTINVKTEIDSQDTITVKTEIDSQEDNFSCENTVQHSVNTTKAKSDLVNKVKSFFNNHFCSESSSNSQPISDIYSQKNSTKTSEEIEIMTCKTHTLSTNNSNSIKSIENEYTSDHENNAINSSKKIRFKKGGLAYRLNNLLKKQKACLSLWHHERFLAANSNFIIPKVENSVFRIQKVNFNYGCYLLEVVDLDESDYLVLINSSYVSDTIISDTIIKVYEPFKIVQLTKETKLLLNVCRFECSEYKA